LVFMPPGPERRLRDTEPHSVDLNQLFSDLQTTAFKDIAGASVSARVPIAASLLSRIAGDALRATPLPIRAVDIRPHAGDRLDVVVTLTWPLVPPLTIPVTIERQPDFPDSPVLLLRWSFLGRLGAMALHFTRALDRLPAGVRIERDRLALDLSTLAAHTGAAPLLRHVKRAALHTTEDHAVVEVDLLVDAQ
jgi:hypothetical protein